MWPAKVVVGGLGLCLCVVVTGIASEGAQTPSSPRIDNVVADLTGNALVVSGARFGQGAEVWVDGQMVPLLPGATDERLDIEVPAAWRSQPGTYRLVVRTAQGRTDTFEVTVGVSGTWGATAGGPPGRPAGSLADAEAAGVPDPVMLGRAKAVAPAGTNPGIAPSVIENPGSPYRTAVGYQALFYNTTGLYNTAAGYGALRANTKGSNNTATGANALWSNSMGSNNLAAGANALSSNTLGGSNTATGYGALSSNTTGSSNTATGYAALSSNRTGSYNTAAGDSALSYNTTGSSNTAVGYNALVRNTTGTLNVALGHGAGSAQTTGSRNIYVGNNGVAGENNTIRIGTAGAQTKTVLAGAYLTRLLPANAPLALQIDRFGQLGTTPSSRRYKTDIREMGQASENLLRLRPVTFRYKDTADPSRDYGLIAEEVAQVYPDLVSRNTDGQVETVLYDRLPSLLLNELQKQQRTVTMQTEQLAVQASQLALLQQRLAELEVRLAELRTAGPR